MKLEEFTKMFNLKIEINIRQEYDLNDWKHDNPIRQYAKFPQVEVYEGGFLQGTFGNGGTPVEVITDYLDIIKGYKLLCKGGKIVEVCPELSY